MAQNGTTNGILPALSNSTTKIISVLSNYPSGLSAKTLIQKTRIPRRTTYRNLKKLLDLGIIKAIGKSPAIYELCHYQSEVPKVAHLLNSDKIQLHNLSFVVRLVDKPSWWDKRGNKMLRLGLDAKDVFWGNNKYVQVRIKDFIVQCHNQSILFMSSVPYWGVDPYDCFIQGVHNFLSALDYVEDLFDFRFFKGGVPNVAVRSSHFVLLYDALAKKCKRDGSKFEVWVDGKLRMWVDMSDPLGSEAGHKDYAVDDMSAYQDFVADILSKEHLKPSELFSLVSDNSKAVAVLSKSQGEFMRSQADYAKNLEAHVEAIKELGAKVSGLSVLFRLGLQKFGVKRKKLLRQGFSKGQKRLFDFFG